MEHVILYLPMKTPYLVSLIVLLATGTYALAQLTPPLQTPTCSPTSAGCQIAPPINAGTYYQEKKSNVVVRLPVASSSILPFLDPTWNPVLQNYPAATPSHFGFDTNGYVRGQGVIANKTLKVGKDWVITTPNTPPVGELFIPYASDHQTNAKSEKVLCVAKGTGLIKQCSPATVPTQGTTASTPLTATLTASQSTVTTTVPSSILTWTSTGATECYPVSGWGFDFNTRAISGTETVTLTNPTSLFGDNSTFIVACTNAAQNVVFASTKINADLRPVIGTFCATPYKNLGSGWQPTGGCTKVINGAYDNNEYFVTHLNVTSPNGSPVQCKARTVASNIAGSNTWSFLASGVWTTSKTVPTGVIVSGGTPNACLNGCQYDEIVSAPYTSAQLQVECTNTAGTSGDSIILTTGLSTD